jgi:hypothetical protein
MGLYSLSTHVFKGVVARPTLTNRLRMYCIIGNPIDFAIRRPSSLKVSVTEGKCDSFSSRRDTDNIYATPYL